MNPIERLRFKTNVPGEKPPKGQVDLLYDPATSGFVMRDDTGAETPVGGVSVVSSTGGNGATDDGKLVEFDEVGGFLVGSNTTNSGSRGILQVNVNTGVAIQAVAFGTSSFAFEAGMQGLGGIAFSTHMSTAPQQQGLQLDCENGDASTSVAIAFIGNCRILEAANSGGDAIMSLWGNDGRLIWYTAGTANNITIRPASLTANRTADFGDASGVIPIVPSYVDLTAANVALAAGDYFWDTTLKKLRLATA